MGQSGLATGWRRTKTDLGALRRLWAGGRADGGMARTSVATAAPFGEGWDIPVADLGAAPTGLARRQRDLLVDKGGPLMTKKEMAKAIAEEMGLTQSQVQEVIRRVLDGITQTLVNEGRIELRNFGVFEVRGRRARRARNPRTGQAVEVPAKRVVTFKPGRGMGERVGRLTGVPGGGAVASAPPEVSG